MHTSVYKNIVPLEIIDFIKDFFDQQPGVGTEKGIVNKNLEYHIPENEMYQIINPYMNKILGNQHEFSTGAYKSSDRPYIIHVDSRVQHDAYGSCMSFDSGVVKDNKAVLIPLVEGPEFRTVTFNAWSNLNPNREDIVSKKSTRNHLQAEDFSHDPLFDVISYLDIDKDYQWQTGDIMTWDRNQWHISNNFRKHKKTKTFLVLFMA